MALLLVFTVKGLQGDTSLAPVALGTYSWGSISTSFSSVHLPVAGHWRRVTAFGIEEDAMTVLFVCHVDVHLSFKALMCLSTYNNVPVDILMQQIGSPSLS